MPKDTAGEALRHSICQCTLWYCLQGGLGKELQSSDLLLLLLLLLPLLLQLLLLLLPLPFGRSQQVSC